MKQSFSPDEILILQKLTSSLNMTKFFLFLTTNNQALYSGSLGQNSSVPVWD